ncbi:Tyrosine-protein kinase jak2, partial [Tyrophagus putrescentiae]
TSTTPTVTASTSTPNTSAIASASTSSLTSSAASSSASASHPSISVFNLLDGSTFEERIGKDETVQVVEDLILKIVSAVLGVNPVGFHLFALYHPKANLWLAPNDRLDTLKERLKLPDLLFHLKIRFLPVNALDLFKQDQKAFEFYFNQVRNDFKAFPKKRLKSSLDSDVYGIALQDELQEVIERQETMDQANVKRAVENICTNRLPKSMQRPFIELIFPIKKKVEDSFVDSYNKRHPSYHVRSSYIRQFMNTIAHHYYDETFEVLYYNPRFNSPARRKFLTYQIWAQQVVTRNDKNDLQPDVLFRLKELMYITLLEGHHGHSIEVSHVNGAPDTITFQSGPQMRSFVSLLAGYYRLSQRQNFDICRDFPSPWIDRLKRVSAHGPVDKEFTREKLTKFSDDAGKHVPFIFRLSRTDFTLFRISFLDKSYSVRVDLRRAAPEYVLMVDSGGGGGGGAGGGGGPSGRSFPTHHALFEYIRSVVVGSSSSSNFFPPSNVSTTTSISSLLSSTPSSSSSNHSGKVAIALIPSENDLPLSLLLCRDKKAEDELRRLNGSFGAGKGDRQLSVIPAKDVKRSQLTTTQNGLFCVRYGDIKGGEEKVTIKEFVSEASVGYFLPEIERWIHLQDSSIVNCRGIIMSPFSVLSELCGTSLADLFSRHAELPVGLLVQAAYYLARSLDYLFSQDFVHGYIRFENLYVSHYTERTLHIKLGDPIGFRQLMGGVGGLQRDRPWLPPEFFDLQQSFLYHKPTSYADVWAFGTTLWQIFNRGERPMDDPRRLSMFAGFGGFPLSNANAAASGSSSSNIPPDVAKLMRQCWLDDYTARIQPCSIFGQMSRLLNAMYQRPVMNEYSKINNSSVALPHADSVPNGLDSRSALFPSSAGGGPSKLPHVNGNAGGNSVHLNDPSSLTLKVGNDYYNSSKGRASSGSKTKLFRKGSSSSTFISRTFSGSRQSLSNISLTSGQTDTTTVNLNEDACSIYDVHVSKELYEIAHIHGSDLTLLKPIGKGNYGSVFKASLRKQYGGATTVAVKIIPENNEVDRTTLDHEMSIMTKLNHKNIVAIIGYCFLDKNALQIDKGYTMGS